MQRPAFPHSLRVLGWLSMTGIAVLVVLQAMGIHSWGIAHVYPLIGMPLLLSVALGQLWFLLTIIVLFWKRPHVKWFDYLLGSLLLLGLVFLILADPWLS